MAKQFQLNIHLGNEAVQTGEDVARLLEQVALSVEQQDYGRLIVDANGNTVGHWAYMGEEEEEEEERPYMVKLHREVTDVFRVWATSKEEAIAAAENEDFASTHHEMSNLTEPQVWEDV